MRVKLGTTQAALASPGDLGRMLVTRLPSAVLPVCGSDNDEKRADVSHCFGGRTSSGEGPRGVSFNCSCLPGAEAVGFKGRAEISAGNLRGAASQQSQPDLTAGEATEWLLWLTWLWSWSSSRRRPIVADTGH